MEVDQMAGKEVVVERRTVKEVWLNRKVNDPHPSHFKVGCGGTKETGPVSELDPTPGRINIHFEEGAIKTIFYNPEWEMVVLHEAYKEPLIVVPSMLVDG